MAGVARSPLTPPPVLRKPFLVTGVAAPPATLPLSTAAPALLPTLLRLALESLECLLLSTVVITTGEWDVFELELFELSVLRLRRWLRLLREVSPRPFLGRIF